MNNEMNELYHDLHSARTRLLEAYGGDSCGVSDDRDLAWIASATTHLIASSGLALAGINNPRLPAARAEWCEKARRLIDGLSFASARAEEK